MKAILSTLLLLAVCFIPAGSSCLDAVQTNSEKNAPMALQPDIHCDPCMLIAVEPTNDPGFLIQPAS